ncbi:Hypothetical protein PBC10988_15090 [Planctomycetales bacterium 10988]|nr:Hypothetical protein PBC10988_15090 [Planctomycetales bacterium 10988]
MKSNQNPFHAYILFPQRMDTVYARLQAVRFRQKNSPEGRLLWNSCHRWTEQLSATYHHGSWKWKLQLAGRGLSVAQSEQVIWPDLSDEVLQAVCEHSSCLELQLETAPENCSPLAQMQAGCDLVWQLLELGATLVAWPAGRTAWHCQELLNLDASEIRAEHFDLFVSTGFAGDQDGDRQWIRTWGMGQFHLPDLAGTISISEPQRSVDLDFARTMFGSLPPYLIERGSALPEGDKVALQDSICKVAPKPDLHQRPFLNSPLGIQWLVREPSEKV